MRTLTPPKPTKFDIFCCGCFWGGALFVFLIEPQCGSIVPTVAFRNSVCLHLNMTHFFGFNNNVYCGQSTQLIKNAYFWFCGGGGVCVACILFKSIGAPKTWLDEEREAKCGIYGIW